MYTGIKHLHMLLAIISIVGFALRGGLRLAGSEWVRRRWLRITPHVVDTLLLLAGIWLAVASQQYPLAQGWLTAKVVGLIVYIGLGLHVMRFATTQRARAISYVLALGCFAYIMLVAFSRSALPWL